MPTERYLRLRQEGLRDMHNTTLLKACKEDSFLLDEFLHENKDFIFSVIAQSRGSIKELTKKFKVEEEEILQQAFVGVITALRTFDFERGTKFTTYAVRPILWEINQLLYSDSRLVRLSRGAVGLLKQMRELSDELGRIPSEGALASALGVPIERIRAVIRFTGEMEHIDGLDGFELSCPDSNPVDEVVNRVYVEQLLERSSLSAFDREVVTLIMGGLNNSQIASRLGTFPMTVNRAVHRIKGQLGGDSSEGRRTSKYEKEIELVANELRELGYAMSLDDMTDLLAVCGYPYQNYAPRILYYIRQKALHRALPQDQLTQREETTNGD